MRAWIISAATCAVLACSSDPPMQGPADSGVIVVDDAGPPPNPEDAGPPPIVACTCDQTEDCRACFEKIGTCCYEDATWFGKIDRVLANCERNPYCTACCNECAAKSCDELRASNDCPI